MESHQDHPTSWNASGQRRYIAVPRHGHRPGNYSNSWPGLHRASYPQTMKSEDGNAPLPSVPDSAADISESTADPATVPPQSPSQSPTEYLISPGTLWTSGPMVLHPLNPAHVPLPPSVTTSDRSASDLSERTGLSVRASRRQQARDDLVHLLSVTSLTDSPPLVKALVGRLSSITRLRAAKRADLEALLLPDGSAPSTDDIKDLLSISLNWPLPRCPQWSHHKIDVDSDEIWALSSLSPRGLLCGTELYRDLRG